ncbi:MAG: histone deacetylase [Acinetobacter sp.]|nr:histone deacetylase [Acinetobacter sp.]
MQKYVQIPQTLLAQNIISEQQLFQPQRATASEILTTHDLHYWQRLNQQQLSAKEIRSIGFDMALSWVERECYIAHASYECALYALHDGVALNTSGGTHHAFRGHGEGFCIFNDLAVASHLLLLRGQAQRILIVDLDVHQGNGTAHIFQHDPRVYTFSMHAAHNYPFEKQHSNRDVALASGTQDDEYLTLLHHHLNAILQEFVPDFIFYQAGVDVLAGDQLGKLALTTQGCRQRDELVFRFAYQHGLPIAVTMGGGYAPQLEHIVQAHCQTFTMAKKVFVGE